jgi:hypothetical protein
MNHITDSACAFRVEEGKVYCKTHAVKLLTADGDVADYLCPKEHVMESVPFQHVLYVGAFCKTCNNGVLHIDAEQ